MIERDVVVTIESVVALFRDYLGDEQIPADARPTRLMYNKNERNKLGVMVESDEWREGMAPLTVKFDIKRVYTV